MVLTVSGCVAGANDMMLVRDVTRDRVCLWFDVERRCLSSRLRGGNVAEGCWLASRICRGM